MELLVLFVFGVFVWAVIPESRSCFTGGILLFLIFLISCLLYSATSELRLYALLVFLGSCFAFHMDKKHRMKKEQAIEKKSSVDPLSSEEKAEVLDTLKAMETATSPTSSQTFPTPPELPAGVSVSNPNSMGNCGSGAGTNSARDWR